MIYYIAPVVEGHSEQKCLERLLQRIWQIILGRTERLQVIPPFRRSRDELVHSNGQVLAQKVQEAHFTLRTTS